MAQSEGPIALVNGQQFTQTPPAGLLNPSAVIVTNRSSFDLQITSPIGITVPAWTAQVIAPVDPGPQSYPSQAMTVVSGIPTLLTGTPNPVGTAFMYLDWLGPGESPSGTYPAVVGAQAVAGNPQAQLCYANEFVITDTSNHTALIAPGVGHAYRIFYALVIAIASTGPDAITLQGTNGTLNFVCPAYATTNGPPSGFPWIAPPSGLLLDDNEAVVVRSTVTGGPSDVVYVNLIYSQDH